MTASVVHCFHARANVAHDGVRRHAQLTERLGRREGPRRGHEIARRVPGVRVTARMDVSPPRAPIPRVQLYTARRLGAARAVCV